MPLTPHDEFLHMGYPRPTNTPWKENYYFNYIDIDANAMGIFHASIQRHKQVASLKVLNIIDGELLQYKEDVPWPSPYTNINDDQTVVGDHRLKFRIIDPHRKQQVLFNNGSTAIDLTFNERFPVYLYPAKDTEDKSFDVAHYEQGLHVEGVVTFKGKKRTIGCLGHRDHTWGHRDESGLEGWHWIAIQSKTATWNFSRVARQNGDVVQIGFISDADSARAVNRVDVLEQENSTNGEPLYVRYRITTEAGETFHIQARRHSYIPILGLNNTPVDVHENISEFFIEELDDSGMGIDEHMVINPHRNQSSV